MIRFVNAKLNIGLHITRRRPDGYHDLETVFYPVGKHNGTPLNPEPFCDILEITPAPVTSFSWSGRGIDCPEEDNLVCRAAKLFADEFEGLPMHVHLDKHLPDGAGLGGGSADASCVLTMLNELNGSPADTSRLERLALRLGADCPVFIHNQPAYAEGVGEKLQPVPAMLDGYWCVIVKPSVHISTREAFAGIVPREGRIDLRQAIARPVSEWRDTVVNDFEASLFPKYPVLDEIKQQLYRLGADYASMSGSGSAIYGIFADAATARKVASDPVWHDVAVFVCRL